MSGARVEAAAKALRKKFNGYELERPWDSREQKITFENDAKAALEAADAVMFSDDAEYLIASAIRDSDWPDYEDKLHHPVKDYMQNARAAIAAISVWEGWR